MKDENTKGTEAITAELARIGGEMKSALEAQAGEIKQNGETAAKTAARIEELGSQYENLETEMKHKLDLIEAKQGRLDAAPVQRKGLGELFVESEEFKNRGKGGGLLNARVEVKAAGIMTTAGNAAGLVLPDRLGYVPNPREAHVRDLFSQATTSSNMIEFPQIKARNMKAAVVADDGSEKPDSDLSLELVQFPVRTIAHLLRIAKSTLDDVPAIRSIIETEMIEGLRDAEDVQLIKGDGTGVNIRGLLAQAKTFNRGFTTDTKLDTLRRALTDLRVSNYRADGYLLNPLDWEDIELLKGTDGKYVWATVTGIDGVTRVWRTPVVDTIAIDEGQFVAGAFKRGGWVFDREEVAVDLFEQDRDNVKRNLVTLRVEERLALVIRDMNAFVKGSFSRPLPTPPS